MTLRALYDLPAPAKVNLFLHVTGRRADGYHLLQSPFVLIDWADTLHFELRDDARLVRHDLADALPADDLCLRAARALQAASARRCGVDISIVKRVPAGAGMGGGSSDAATTLLALNRLWGLGWPRERLAAIGLSLGADLPFFIGGRNAFVEGIGEKLTAIELPSIRLAVVKPPPTVETRAIFEHPAVGRDTDPVIVEGSPEARARVATGAASVGLAEILQGYGRNDLQAAAEAHCPEVAQAARWLEARYGNSRMTGSGSAVFARVGTGAEPTAPFAAEELPAGWVGRMCRSLIAHPLAAWTG